MRLRHEFRFESIGSCFDQSHGKGKLHQSHLSKETRLRIFRIKIEIMLQSSLDTLLLRINFNLIKMFDTFTNGSGGREKNTQHLN